MAQDFCDRCGGDWPTGTTHNCPVMGRRVELWDINGRESFKVGEARETFEGVRVDVPAEYGLPNVITGEIPRLKRGLQVERIGPGHPGYFSEVVIDLSRAFAIRDPDRREELREEVQRHEADLRDLAVPQPPGRPARKIAEMPGGGEGHA